MPEQVPPMKKYTVQFEGKVWKTLTIYAKDEEDADRIANDRFDTTPIDNSDKLNIEEVDWCLDVDVQEDTGVKKIWCVAWKGTSNDGQTIIHDVVVDADLRNEAISEARDHFYDNRDYYVEGQDPDFIYEGEVKWEVEPFRVEVVGP
jgi:hypothetical protein